MGQAADSGAKAQQDSQRELANCRARLERVERLLAEPEQLEKECNFQFQRAPLDSHGDMRRIELRRLLWTFANHLGAEELTWETIEVAAVVGTVEPQVPVVTRAEFYRCVLKTVHLVGAELRGRADKAHAALQHRAKNLADGQMPADKAPLRPPLRPPPRSAEQGSESSEDGTEDESDEQENQQDAEVSTVPMFLPAPAGEPALHAEAPEELLAPPGSLPRSNAPHHGHIALPDEAQIFSPAPGGGGDDAAAIHGMMALTLNTEATFDPQRITVSRGLLMLRDPEDNGQQAFDLRSLDTMDTGESIANSASATLLPGYVRNAESLERMLMLAFDGDEALCLWFNTADDCRLCLDAIKDEAIKALDENPPGEGEGPGTGGHVARAAVSWMTGILGGNHSEDED